MKMRFIRVAPRVAGDNEVAADRAPVQAKHRRWNSIPPQIPRDTLDHWVATMASRWPLHCGNERA
jgi:hypothetical protein